MQFKKVSLILSFIVASTVLSAPINEDDVNNKYITVDTSIFEDNIDKNVIINGKNPFIEASPIPVKSNKNLFENLLKEEKGNDNVKGKNPYIEASPIPVKSNKNLFEGLLNKEKENNKDVKGKNPYIEASPIPVKSNKNLYEGLLNKEKEVDNDKNSTIETSSFAVKADKNLAEGLLNAEKNKVNGKNPLYEASPIPVKSDKNLAENLLNAEEDKITGKYITVDTSVFEDNVNKNVNGKNPFIEASPIPVKADKNLFEGFTDNKVMKKAPSFGNTNRFGFKNYKNNNANGKNPFIEASPIPVKADKNLFEDLVNKN